MKPVYIARVTEVAARALDGEMMIMSARDSTLFTLNPVATLIWQSADGTTPLADIVEHRICTEFQVDPATAMDDARGFVNDLAGHGILVTSDQPIPSTPAARGVSR
jgi:hypothetical protein